MTHITRFPILAAVMSAAFLLANLAPIVSNEAVAQITISGPGINRSYYNGYDSRYSRGRGPGYGRYGYTGYGNGPYGYGSAVPYGYPSSPGYGYQRGPSINLNYRYYGGGYSETYQHIYVPNNSRYYSPFGYGYSGY